MNSDYHTFSSLFRYKPETGKLFWRESRCKVKAEMEAGSIQSKGYIQVQVNGCRYYAHRIAWLLAHGEWPEHQIDHINGVKDDNRISNLRVVTNRENGQNRKEHRNGGLVGASFHKPTGRWQSQVKVDGKQVHLGRFETEQEAHEAYKAALEGNDEDRG